MTRFERFLSNFTKIRPGEGRGILLLGLNGFLLVCGYYILKTLRESLILAEFGAETKSYAVGAIAVVLFFVVPLYGVLFRHTNRTQLVIIVNSFFITHLFMFYMMSQLGISFAFQYYIWIGVFGVMVIAQFWAYTSDIYNVRSGQRVFPVIMIATSLGGLVGAEIAAWGFPTLGTFGLMLLAGILLTASLFLYRPARLAAPEDSRCIECEYAKPKFQGLFGGFAMVFSSHYLRMIALFVVLLNWVNSTGEYILSEMVVRWASEKVGSGGTELSEEALIAWFYGNYSFSITLFGLLLQTFLVAKILRVIGMPRSLMILPVLAAVGYAFVAFVPIFSIIRLVKTAENGVDYSLVSTIRQALFLPTSREVKYEGKTAIDTFFWRFGDLLQGGVIFLGINVFGFGIKEFALSNMVVAIVWCIVAMATAKEYCSIVSSNSTSNAPVLTNPIPNLSVARGQHLDFVLRPDTFVDPDPGDIVRLRATLADGSALPSWLTFHASEGRFVGIPPADHLDPVEITVTASDFEDLETTDSFYIRFEQDLTQLA